jgi:hypothetical protein
LSALQQAGLRVICAQNQVGLKHLDNPVIIGWMHPDEPDNAQSLGQNRGYGPPVTPARVVEDYDRMRQADPSRPVLLNLGQGVAWDNWHGRGVRTNHPEDYPEYIKGCDIASFDIYPVVHPKPEVGGKLWYVARGVERLVNWAQGRKPVWNCLECTRISHPTAKPTPRQVRCEAWMSLIHGSAGLIYFVHEWVPSFNESALLDDPAMIAAVTALNRQILELAPVLNQPNAPGLFTVTTDNPDIPVTAAAKQYRGAAYLFAVAMREGATTAKFTLNARTAAANVEVLGEGRSLPLKDGVFSDQFAPWDVHLYRIAAGDRSLP